MMHAAALREATLGVKVCGADLNHNRTKQRN